jgi:hypothetical protein
MARARIHKTQPPRAHRAPIETILQAAAVHVAFKGMAKVFDLPPNGLLASAAPCNGVPAYNRLGEWPRHQSGHATRRQAPRR